MRVLPISGHRLATDPRHPAYVAILPASQKLVQMAEDHAGGGVASTVYCDGFLIGSGFRGAVFSRLQRMVRVVFRV